MTTPTLIKGRRLLALEREVRLLRRDIAEALKLRVQNALLVATNSRLIGENDALRRSLATVLARKP